MKRKYRIIIFILLCFNGVSILLMWMQQNCIIKWKKNAEKKTGQYMIMNQWTGIKQDGKSMESYFVKHRYGRIAVYGMNHIGLRLLKELKNSKIEVVYGIDKNAKNIYADVRVVTLQADIPDVDAVVVTVVEGFDDISEAIAKKVQCPIIAIEDILNAI